MNAPHGKIDSLRIQRLLPREDMLIDAVDERAVKIEEESWFDTARAHRRCFAYSGTSSPEPPAGTGKSFNFGSPSLIGKTVST